jgi:hypothetical protein
MAIERERERRRTQPQGAPPEGPGLEPAQDVSRLARRASASADAVAAEPAGIEVAIRTTTSRTSNVVRMVATPDTPVSEIMTEACAGLDLPDRQRYVLVANGEVLADGGRPLGDLVQDGQASALEMRLVRKPEAGRRGDAGAAAGR